MVDTRGRVVTTVFAATQGGGPEGGFGVPNAIVRSILARASGPVDTGPCAQERRRRRGGRGAGRYADAPMAKTLVIAEKPSVGQDLARVLPGPFQKHTGAGEKTARWLEGPDHVITWAVGHLVQLAEPDEYDDKFKKWRMADLPIVPRSFKLVVRDERSQKQMSVVRDLLRRDDV